MQRTGQVHVEPNLESERDETYNPADQTICLSVLNSLSEANAWQHGFGL